jgi:hypothetical protein
MTIPDLQKAEWTALYADLRALLQAHGQEDASGEGDYWLVDDNYGTPQHKICVTNISILTRPLCRQCQRLLRQYSLPWELLFSLENRAHEGDLGVTVTRAAIEEHWNAERLALHHQAAFRWNLAAI